MPSGLSHSHTRNPAFNLKNYLSFAFYFDKMTIKKWSNTVQLNHNEIKKFFAYANERERIRISKESGAPKPWTKDEILLQHRFCNVFREDDKVTRWFRDNIRQPLRNDPTVLLATFAFRFFNLPSSAEVMLDHGGLEVFKTENWLKNAKSIARGIKKNKQKVTGAYMTKTPTGLDKTDGCMQVIKWFIEGCVAPPEALAKHLVNNQFTLKQTTEWLSEAPFMGPFCAYEVVTDLYHTYLLENASDIMTWANPGPGAARGLSRMCGEDKTALKRNRAADVTLMQELMHDLLILSRLSSNWLFPRDWDMRTVEHTLCEYDKYERTRQGQGQPRSRYQGA